MKNTRKAVIHALISRAKNECSILEILAKEMDYLHRALLQNNYPDWIIKESEKKPATPMTNPDIGLEVKKNFFISVLLFLALVRNLGESIDIPVYRSSSKEQTP